MPSRLLLRAVTRPPHRPLLRTLSTHAPPRQFSHNAYPRRLYSLGLASGVLVATSLVVVHSQSAIHADTEASATPSPPLTSLVRSYVVYAMCSIPSLVDWSPTILSTCLSVPGVRTITEVFVRVTFFDQVSSQRDSSHNFELQSTRPVVCRCRDGRRCASLARAIPRRE